MPVQPARRAAPTPPVPCAAAASDVTASTATAAAPRPHDLRHVDCHDLDEQAARLDGWNLRYCQLSPGRFEGSVATLDAGGVRLVAERLNRTLLQRGAVTPGRLVLGVPVDYDGHAALCGRRAHRDGLHLFSGDGGFEFLSPAEHLVINLEIDPDALQRPALRATARELAARLGPRPTVLDLPPATMAAWREQLQTLLATLHRTPGCLAADAARDAFERTVVHGVADALDSVLDDGAADMGRPWRLVRAVQARVDASADDCPLSVAELVQQLGTSRRSLQYAFESALGLNPAAYLRAERLNRARAALARAGSVTEAATRFGFWHFGRFATDYRTLFGERPSETFRRRQGRVNPPGTPSPSPPPPSAAPRP